MRRRYSFIPKTCQVTIAKIINKQDDYIRLPLGLFGEHTLPLKSIAAQHETQDKNLNTHSNPTLNWGIKITPSDNSDLMATLLRCQL